MADMQAGVGPFLGVFLLARGWQSGMIGTVMTIVASAVILASQKVWVVAASQVATAIAGAAIVPAVSGIALGMVRQAGFPRQNGRNQAFNHAGNVAGAALSGLLGWRFGLPAVFWLAAAFGALSIGSVLRIRPESIDDVAARGLEGSV